MQGMSNTVAASSGRERATSCAKWPTPVIRASLLLVALAGCATVDPSPDYELARQEVEAATGRPSLYNPGEDEATRQLLDQLFQDGLTSQEAVQGCLLNNPELQAALLDIGMARADAVQAGLLSNPSLELMIRIPTDGNHTNTEGGIIQNLVELWQLPDRELLAERRLEQTVLEVAHTAARLAAQSKSAYVAALAARDAESVAHENLETARAFLELTLQRQSAGAATEVDVNAARSELLEQQVLARASRFDAFEAKRQLALLLGFDHSPDTLELTDTLAGPPDSSFDLDDLISRALRRRLDLRAAEREAEAAVHALDLERSPLLRSAGAGVALESEGGDWAIGPAVEVELPIFDQNQAQIAKAEFRLAQTQRRLEALSTLVAQQVRGAHARYSLARDTVRLYEQDLLPLRQTSLDLAREAFAAGKTGFLSVLEAQNRLVTARREYVGQLEALARTVPELEAACGQPFTDLLRPGPSPEAPLPEAEGDGR